VKSVTTRIVGWIVFGLILSILAVPLIVSHDTLYPFIFGKIIAFRILIQLILSILAIGYLFGARITVSWRHPLIITLGICIAVQIVASVIGVDFWRSLWSTQERMTGLLTTFHFAAFFLVAIATIQSLRQWKWLIAFSLAISLIVAALGLFERNTVQIASVLGNPIYVSVYAMIHVYLAAILFTMAQRQIGFQFLAVIAGLTNIAVMFLAGGRGVILAFLVSICILALTSIFFLSKKMRKIFLSGIVVLSIAAGGILWYGATPKGTQWAEKNLPYSIKRIVLLPQYWNPENRTEVWRIGLEGFKERPILGWGWESFSYIFQKYYVKPVPGEGTTYFDRSHNQLIDILSLNGIVGLGAYFALWGALYWMILRRMKRSTDVRQRGTLLLLIGVFTAYFLQNLTVFDTPAPLIMFYVLLAFAYFLCNEEEYSQQISTEKTSRLRPLHAVPLSFLIGVIAVYAIYEFNIKPYMASAETVAALRLAQRDPMSSLEHFKRALSSHTFTNYENRLQLAKYALASLQQGGSMTDGKKDLLDFAIKEIQKNTKEHPLDVKNYYALSALNRVASEYDAAALERAEEALKRAAELAPMRPETFSETLQLYVQKLDVEKSKEWAGKVAEHVNRGEAHYQLGQLYLRRKEFASMLTEMQTALKEGYNIYENTSVYVYLTKTILLKSITPQIIAFIDAAALANQNSPDMLGSRILIHYKAGDRATAVKYLEELRVKNADIAKAMEEYLKKE